MPKRKLQLKYVQAKTLKGNPHNWRTHPEGQLKALGSVLEDEEIGWAGALLYNSRTQRLVDGHGRLKLVKPNDFVPVLVGDWSEAAEKKILVTLDPLAKLAGTDAEKLKELLEEVDLDTPDLKAVADDLGSMLEDLMKDLPGDEEPGAGGKGEGGGSGSGDRKTPQFLIIVECRDEKHQRKLSQKFIDDRIEHRTLTPDE